MNFIKRDNGFFPYYKLDVEQFQKLKNQQIYSCTVRQDNNPEFHAKIFAIATVVAENLPEDSPIYGADAYQFIKATEIELGFVKWITKLNGEKYPEPESISFENWDQLKREEFYSKALPLWARIIKVTIEELETNSISYM
jgi:hypothetical protein